MGHFLARFGTRTPTRTGARVVHNAASALHLLAAAAACVGASVVGANADDSFPPCWRGVAGTTYQDWTFAASNNPAAPENFNNPNGTPQAVFTIGTAGTGWRAAVLSRTNVWDLGKGGAASVSIPNLGGGSNSWKYVQVQVTYFEDGAIYVAPSVSIAGASLVSSQVINNQTAFPGAWKTMQTVWQVQPAPPSETVAFTGNPSKGLLLDQIIVDTRSTVPGGDVPAFRPCWRGLTNSTFQQWQFGVSNSPGAIYPEIVTNMYGVPAASISLGPFSSAYVLQNPFLGCVQGIWDLGRSGTMTLSLPNSAGGSGGSYKYVAVQVTQYRDSIYNTNATVSVPGGTLMGRQEQTVVTTSNVLNGIWVTEQTMWRLGPPSPGMETVVITGGTNGSLIDQVVADTLLVDIPCPGNIAGSADAGQCSKSNVTWSVPVVDGCVVTNVACVPAIGSTFPVGTNAVSMVISDSEGGTRTCNFDVIITDDESPSVTCPADITVVKATNICGAYVSFSPVPMDNCPGAIVESIPPGGSLFPLGLTIVTNIAHDHAGNASPPCTFTVRVVDFGGDVAGYQPCWRGLAGTTFQQWAFSVSNNPAGLMPELATNSYGSPIGVIVPGPFSSGYVEQNPFLGCVQGIWDLGRSGTMTLSVPNSAGGSGGSYKYVAVQVTQYRDSIYNTNATVSVPGGTLMGRQEQTVVTTSNLLNGIWVTEQTVWRLGPPSPGMETVVITGGTNGSLIDQVVADTLVVDIPCPGNIAGSADAGQCSKSNVTWSVPVVDGCVVTNVACVPAIGSTFPVGTNAVSMVISDSEGGTRTCNFDVIITDDESPVALGTNIVVNLDAMGQVAVTAAQVDGGSTDNCGIASRTISNSVFTCANVGPNVVELTVVDIHGHASSCNATVTVQDTLAPVITCPANIAVSAASGVCGSNVTFAVGAVDNCGLSNLVSMPPSGSFFPVGTTAVTNTATDVYGNTSTCTFTVTVIDQEPPVITAPTNMVVTADPGQCSASNVTFSVTSSDNCPGDNLVQLSGLPSGSTFPKGVTTNVFQATDHAGNTSTNTFTVTVDDGEPPVIAAVLATQTQPGSGTVDVKNCADTAIQGTVTISVQASDSCAILNPEITLTNGSFASTAVFVNESPAGVFNYTWDVTTNTANGTWVATVLASDGANTTVSSFTLCVNKAEVTGVVQMDTFRFGISAGYAFGRTVTFIATDSGGVPLMTWNVPVAFTNNIATGMAAGNYVLADVPPATAQISAKTSWSLRRRLSVTLDANLQGQLNFANGSRLLGGDLNGNNIVNLGDYNILAVNWLQISAAADINGDGIANLSDYNILASYWFLAGDPP